MPAFFSHVVMQNYERAFRAGERQVELFDGLFRRPYDRRPRHLREVFGRKDRYLTLGFGGYAHGKSIMRTNRPALLPGIHTPRKSRKTEARNEVVAGLTCSSAVLLHFDGLTPAHWVSKLERYAAQERYSRKSILEPARLEQVKFARKHKDNPARLMDLHDRIKCVSPDEEARLTALGFLTELDFDAHVGLRTHGLDEVVDLSAASFDQRLAGGDAPSVDPVPPAGKRARKGSNSTA